MIETLDDQEIITLYVQRDETAIWETKKKYGSKLTGLSYKILGNSEDSEECVSDTYFKLWNKIPPDKPQFFFAYIAKICRFFAFGKLDEKKAKKRTANVISLTEELVDCIPDGFSQIPFEEIILSQILEQFLLGISQEKRLIFLRRYWFSDSISEISNRFQCSESKVKTTLYRVREELKNYLEKENTS